jgi:hypothetical protein
MLAFREHGDVRRHQEWKRRVRIWPATPVDPHPAVNNSPGHISLTGGANPPAGRAAFKLLGNPRVKLTIGQEPLGFRNVVPGAGHAL